MPTSSEAPSIEIQGLSKRYLVGSRFGTFREQAGRLFRRKPEAEGSSTRRDLWALRDLSLSIPAGEAVGIVGPNGAGKSTLLKCLARIVEPTEGQAVICGRVASVLGVGAGFHSELTGAENILLGGSILGMEWREIHHKMQAIAEFAEVASFLDTPVKHYSTGMRARLAFAVAAFLEPDILLVDETLAVGDEAFQRKCLARMASLARQGGIVCLVTHEKDLVQELCTSALLLSAGRLVARGNTAEVLAAYASLS